MSSQVTESSQLGPGADARDCHDELRVCCWPMLRCEGLAEPLRDTPLAASTAGRAVSGVIGLVATSLIAPEWIVLKRQLRCASDMSDGPNHRQDRAVQRRVRAVRALSRRSLWRAHPHHDWAADAGSLPWREPHRAGADARHSDPRPPLAQSGGDGYPNRLTNASCSARFWALS